MTLLERLKTPERVAEHLLRHKLWRQKYPERYLASKNKYKQNHKAKIKAAEKSYRERNRVILCEKAKAYAGKHRERYRILNKRWVENNRGKFNAHVAKRHAAKRIGFKELTPEQRQRIDEIYELAASNQPVRFYYCCKLIPEGQREVDHKQPISKGGRHHPDNLEIACARCNISKKDKTEDEYLAYIKPLLAF